GSNLSGVDLSRASLKHADMNGAILCHTKLRRREDNTGCKWKEP
ncbi:MAG: pentapeptide repeat-containing protein, partial [bacterium]|nr:pentapeptide repeat-containing protein [bacterium]